MLHQHQCKEHGCARPLAGDDVAVGNHRRFVIRLAQSFRAGGITRGAPSFEHAGLRQHCGSGADGGHKFIGLSKRPERRKHPLVGRQIFGAQSAARQHDGTEGVDLQFVPHGIGQQHHIA